VLPPVSTSGALREILLSELHRVTNAILYKISKVFVINKKVVI
jgi:hypothetical protein